MTEVAQRYQDELKGIKKDVERAFVYWKPNIDRYHRFQKSTFQTAISPEQEDTLKTMGKPVIEFNITNAPVSRLCGEFSKQEPSIYVSSEDGAQVDPQTIEVVEGHIRHILFETKKHNTQYKVYRNQLSGGFSNFKVWTDYAHEMSMDQIIKVGFPFDDTLTGYDPTAREIDKSDAEFCFEIFPMSKEDFKRKYPKVDLESVQFLKAESGFNWSYNDERNEYIIVLVDFYRKKKKRVKIAKIADGRVMTLDDYEEFLKSWQEQQFTAQPPAIIDERTTEICSVCRYRVMETEVIEYKETSFKYLPLVFADGDSVILKNGESSSMEQFTKPYVYHTDGIQQLTNFSGQVIANDFENMVMHKFKVAEESLPSEAEFRKAYTEYQAPNLLVYKSLWNDNPDVQLPPPQEIARVPLPPEVVQTFNTSMQMLQNILGSYDASLGINDNQLSGVAIVEAATQSNAAAMPYIVNYMQALNQVANIVVDLIPKYYKTPRTIPIVTKDGKKDYVKINQPGGITFNYDENSLQVKVEAGVNFQIAKNKALQQIIALMQASPQFAAFINEAGLETLLDNIEFRNVDLLKGKVQQWLQQKQQQAAQQPNPDMIKAQAMMQQQQLAQQKLAQDDEKMKGEALLKTEEHILNREKLENEKLSMMLKAGASKDQLMAQLAKAQAEEERAKSDIEIRHADLHLAAHQQGHQQIHDTAKMLHEVNQSKQQTKENDNG